MQDVHTQGGARQSNQAQLQALARVAVQGVGLRRALHRKCQEQSVELVRGSGSSGGSGGGGSRCQAEVGVGICGGSGRRWHTLGAPAALLSSPEQCNLLLKTSAIRIRQSHPTLSAQAVVAPLSRPAASRPISRSCSTLVGRAAPPAGKGRGLGRQH